MSEPESHDSQQRLSITRQRMEHFHSVAFYDLFIEVHVPAQGPVGLSFNKIS